MKTKFKQNRKRFKEFFEKKFGIRIDEKTEKQITRDILDLFRIVFFDIYKIKNFKEKT